MNAMTLGILYHTSWSRISSILSVALFPIDHLQVSGVGDTLDKMGFAKARESRTRCSLSAVAGPSLLLKQRV